MGKIPKTHEITKQSLPGINKGDSNKIYPEDPILLLPKEKITITISGAPRMGNIKPLCPDIDISPILITRNMWNKNQLTLKVINKGNNIVIIQDALAQWENNTKASWTEVISSKRPTLKIRLEGVPLVGLIDSGADTTVLSMSDFNRLSWNGRVTEMTVTGVGGNTTMGKVTDPIHWEFENKQGILFPLINDKLDITLWGRDLLSEMQCSITTDFSGGPLT